jgi:hypothetical protein
VPYKDVEQRRLYQREWMAAHRREWLEANGPCIDCGSWGELEVDHADAATKVDHKVWSWSKLRRDAELSKCVARCNPCHKRKSAGEQLKGEDRLQNVKLTESQVLSIRESPLSCSALGAQYGVHRVTISKIKRRVIWKHLA